MPAQTHASTLAASEDIQDEDRTQIRSHRAGANKAPFNAADSLPPGARAEFHWFKDEASVAPRVRQHGIRSNPWPELPPWRSDVADAPTDVLDIERLRAEQDIGLWSV
jgi:hypothetical protein